MSRVEISSATWLPAANHFGNLLESDVITYAIFGAGALAVQNVIVRPTIDIDFVVKDYDKAVNLLKTQPNLSSTNLQQEKDGIQVADFYFESGVTIQIWDDNLYSLPMTDDSWSRNVLKQIPGYDSIWSISMEDLIVSKVGRYTQQKPDSEYEATKNVNDIVATIQTLDKPDFKYVIQRLMEGARRETSSKFSKTHRLDWYFVKEVEIYRKMAEKLDQKKIGKFIGTVLTKSKSTPIEYWLLHSLRKVSSVRKFQSSFMLDKDSLLVLLDRWKPILNVDGDKVSLSSKNIQNYVNSLPTETLSEYAKRLIFSGKT